ncbi:MAG: DEAD/DEAH box helicase [Bacteroidales bacterium]|nr:DEAD/DEAH box helicase [Bacteroidales bacterium]
MDAFRLHKTVTENYREYIRSFINIKDERIRRFVEGKFEKEGFIPEPFIHFNPSYQREDTLADLHNEGLINGGLVPIIGTYQLYKHQVEGIRKGVSGQGFIVTSGTGSGKSLIYLATVFNNILNLKEKQKGVKAILVYPMNALINSQKEEIMKYELNYLLQFVPEDKKTEFDPKSPENKDLSLENILKKSQSFTGKEFPVSYAKYTGQEDEEERTRIEYEQPDIILTNYMMMELIMTRAREKWMRTSIKDHLAFLVFDELHTYRGRQGSDVSLLIRRVKDLAKKTVICIGTSATMTTVGSREDKKKAVAEVASTIFGNHYENDQVIGEYLENCTCTETLPGKFELQEGIHQPIFKEGGEEDFVKHPLAIWIENKIALFRTEDGFIERGKPRTLSEIVRLLADDSGEREPDCEKAIRTLLDWAEALNIKANRNHTFKSFLPYKLHQFISQTSTVYVTLEHRDKRTVSLETGRYVRENDRDKYIYPLLFSRHSGHEFICVRKNFAENILEPRDPSEIPVQITKDDLKGDRETGLKPRKLTEQDFTDGYLIIPYEGEEIWSDENIEDLPQSWWRVNKGRIEVYNYYFHRLPSKIYFDESGHFSSEPKYNQWGWFMPAKLLFDPTAGLIYDLKTSENTKLMRLGNEGRSTATTMAAYTVVSELHHQGEPGNIQKLLSFTDNRQDASLQAGHFNDFINTGRLRSALYHTLKKAEGNCLKISELAERVLPQLNLKESDYARGEVNDDWTDPENERALKKYLLIRILYDLRRGWRYNLPNLEQTALLVVDYDLLDQFCEKEDFFKNILLFDNLSPYERKHILVQFLNFFRTSYALDHPLITTERSEAEEFIKLKMDPDKLWSLDKNEKIEVPLYMVSRNPGETQRYVYTASIGPHSYAGKYFKRLFKKHNLDQLRGDDYIDYIDLVCELLKKANLLSSEDVRGRRGIVKGYRLRVDHVVWKLGDGNTVLPDEVRLASYKEQKTEPNKFFRQFYQTDFTKFHKQFIGKEHTGQLGNSDRITRETRFRSGELSALFCSPTMELGIDIADLNIVHMRNVPPTPANYVQRSGRAGRSGQTALVINYCSNLSPHDRHYFREPEKMVAGAVVPPRIDLLNEELILTHFNAYILMNLGLDDLKVSISDIIDTRDKKTLSVKSHTISFIENAVQFYKDEWIAGFEKIIRASIPEIEKTNWFNFDWLYTRAANFYERFNAAFERWRILFRNAEEIIQKSRTVMDDPALKQSSPVMSEAKRQHNIGLMQRALLLNESGQSYGNESEFYVFRYLASEGFLPGYNFTRLPVRTFVGYKHQEQGEYISRARFIALREFGPGNLIYHNGNKYRINRMMLADASLKKRKIKISTETCYAFLDEDTERFNNDPITNKPLKDQSSTQSWNNLLELTETEASPQERISCEEEERTREGFEITQYFNYPKGIESTVQSIVKEGNQPLLRIIFCQATQLIQVNHRWKRSKDANGFYIDDRNGRWLRQKELEDPETNEHGKEVRLFARDHADSLYIQPVKDLGLNPDQVVSLAYALKRAVERLFEVEESEIGVWIMGKKEEQNIMLYESAEGSLGILSQLVESASRMKELFRTAYATLHFNPETLEDDQPDIPKATYDDLLSYYNQRFHDQLDRFSVKRPLERLMHCDIVPTRENADRDEQYKYLLENYDKGSATELKFIRYLKEHDIVYPDKAQVNIKECYVNADFVYKTTNGPVLVFCDGTVHDTKNVMEEDDAKRQCLRDHGYDVIVWRHSEPLHELVERRKDVFRKI